MTNQTPQHKSPAATFSTALGLIPTEQLNPNTRDIDLLPTEAMLRRINQEDAAVLTAVERAIPQITVALDRIVEAFGQGGRLLYFGAGTSGRLGVLDASECPPTYGTPPEMVQAFMAGGDIALRHAVEGAEDNFEDGKLVTLEDAKVTACDVVVGISASGQAPWVLGVIEAAKKRGAFTVGLTCVTGSPLAQAADQPIEAVTGPEVVAGSTRLKAGTAQKLILNMLTTGAMVQLGKTYENWMVDVRPTNEKLKQRAVRIVSTLAHVDETTALKTLESTNYLVKQSVLMLAKQLTLIEAEQLLNTHFGKLRPCLE